LNVPLLDLRAQYLTIKDEVRVELDAVYESQHFILGPKVAALEQAIVPAEPPMPWGSHPVPMPS
jgi:hypothetical protein